MLVTDRPVTAHARNLFVKARMMRHRNRLDHCLVACAARIFSDSSIAFVHLDRFVKTAEREIVRMPEPVRSLCIVFSDRIVRSVTVVAGRNIPMTGFDPAIVLFVHDVTICAGGGIVAEVRITFGIDERIDRDAKREADANAGDSKFYRSKPHPDLILFETNRRKYDLNQFLLNVLLSTPFVRKDQGF